MIKKPSRSANRVKKHKRLRYKIVGTTEKPRLCVFKSNNHMYAQVIDDTKGHTLAAASTLEGELKGKLEITNDTEAAKVVGELVAKRAVEKGVKTVVFDRSGYIFHGKIQALADAAREAGLEF